MRALSFAHKLQLCAPTSISRSRCLTTHLPDYNTPVDVDQIKLSKPQQHKAVAAPSEKDWRRRDLDGTSLVDDTLRSMEKDVEFQQTQIDLKTLGKKTMTLNEKKNRRRALDELGVPDFKEFITQQSMKDPKSSCMSKSELNAHHFARQPSTVLQLNIGLYCNQACAHCHVESSPRRKEMMTIETADRCLYLLKNSPEVKTLDITGGAPELNPAFRHLVSSARALRPDLDIIDRCNLTVVHEPGQSDLVSFLAANKVRVVASLPCYSAANVNTQRGAGVFDRSISALLKLNEAGYGKADRPDLKLDLVYNPLGAFLPPPQVKLEDKYRKELAEQFGISFTQLYTITNMPVKRFADFLHRRGELQQYMDLLVRNFNLSTTPGLMCKNTVSVGWDGKLYDCDFNQQLGLVVGQKAGAMTVQDLVEDSKSKTIFHIERLGQLKEEEIVFENHCFGCTAGMGSSCEGVVA